MYEKENHKENRHLPCDCFDSRLDSIQHGKTGWNDNISCALYEVDDYYAAIEETDYQTGIVIRILGHEVYRNLTVDESAKP